MSFLSLLAICTTILLVASILDKRQVKKRSATMANFSSQLSSVISENVEASRQCSESVVSLGNVLSELEAEKDE